MATRILLAVCLSLLVATALIAADDPAPLTPAEVSTLSALGFEQRALDAEQKALTLERERWATKVAAFKASVEAARPGYVWNPETGALTVKK